LAGTTFIVAGDISDWSQHGGVLITAIEMRIRIQISYKLYIIIDVKEAKVLIRSVIVTLIKTAKD
jgi:hypothetical protein